MSLQEQITKSKEIKRVAGYLRNVFEVEIAYDILDKIAKARKIEDFCEGLYTALRLQEKTQREKKKEGINNIYIPSGDDLQKVVELAKQNLKETSRYLASLALAYPSKRTEKKEESISCF
ncbi:MAG TPA: hypothetical protein VNM22_06780 [Candidatus Limnocylindrales bacterium]|nr:hypothetical protein [Candidatus Limnocylindrales bacterium]